VILWNCITILEKIKYLHDRNIIMGDINPLNILVVSPTEVYFVDTDSYQVENFPCPVGTINYTAPEIQRKHFSTFLRTIGNENFAVATLLFMIMLPGKPPYSQQGGEDPINNVIRMNFSYPFGDNSNKKTPDGPWRYIWSHLTYDLKEAFFNTFKKNCKYSKENTRLSCDEWLSIFKYYLDLLDSGKFGEQDKMSEELFPTRHKKSPNINYVICKLCNNEVPETQCRNGICKDCLGKTETYTCKKCGKPIQYSNYQKYIKNAKRFDICSDCFEYENKVVMQKICATCGNKFEITQKQYDFYINKGLDIPKRCKSCRNKNPSKNSIFSSLMNLFK
jgi:serine/threonine protein kinase